MRYSKLTVDEEFFTVSAVAVNLYEMLYSEWKNEGLNIADSIPIFTGSISGDPSVVVWAYVTQNPEYLLRKNSKGQWKFYSYTGDLSLNQNWSVYNASIS